ncbi:MAG: HPP family protein [Acidimicrobiales bacterium]
MAIRIGLLSGTAVFVLGAADRFLTMPLLTAAIGPTAYVFVAHPHSEASRLRNAVIGHATAIGVGLLALATFGLWNAQSTVAIGHATLAQAGASGMAVAITLGLLHVLHTHHAPAAATTLLVATGLAHPGKPLIGLAVGLVGLMLMVPMLGSMPLLPYDPEESPND